MLTLTITLIPNCVILALNNLGIFVGGVHSDRTLTQEDHGDNQITLEDATQMVSDWQLLIMNLNLLDIASP